MDLTITVEDEVLQDAQIRALQENTSITAVMRDYLIEYAGLASRRFGAANRLLNLSRTSTSGRGHCRWTRDELHDR